MKRDGRRALPSGIALLCLACLGLVAPTLFGSAGRGPGLADKVIAASRDVITVRSPVEVAQHPRIVLEHGTVSHSTPRAGKATPASSLNRNAYIAIARAKISIALDGDETIEATAPERALAPILQAVTGLGFRSLTLSSTDIHIHFASGAVGVLEAVSAEITDGREIRAEGSLSYRGEKVTFDVAFARPSAATPAVPIRAKIAGSLLSARFDGHVSFGDKVQIQAPDAELQIGDVRAMARWLGELWPTGPGLGAVTAKGLLLVDDKAVTFENAKFTIDGNDATGALTLSLNGPRPAFQGTLAFDTLSLAPYTARKSSVLSIATGVLADLGLPGLAAPSLVREIDADLRLSASAVSAGDIRLGGLAASINIKDGKLMGEIAEMELEHGGRGMSRFEFDATGSSPRMLLAADLQDVDLGKLGQLFGRPLVEGQGKLSLNLNADGVTEQAILGSATGTMAIEMLEGGQLGFNVDALKKAASASATDVSVSSFTSAPTPIDRLAARFRATSGVFTAESFAATSLGRELTAQGEVNVPDRDLDLTIAIKRASEAAPAPGAPPREAYRVRGPWSSPAVTPIAHPGKSAAPTIPSGNDAAKSPG